MSNDNGKNLAAHDIAKVFNPIGKSPMTFEAFKVAQKESCVNPGAFWSTQAKERLDWYVPFTTAMQGDFAAGDIAFFCGGKLVSHAAAVVQYHCIERSTMT
jgi:acetyl-CoA synthetase